MSVFLISEMWYQPNFTIVALDLDFIALDMDNSEIHLVLGHETLTYVVSYQ